MQALFVAWYNFARKHEALKGQTPAMASGLADHVWTIKELIERGVCMLARKTGRPSLLAMNFFGDGPLGPWPDKFTFVEELGCAFTLIGFVVFLVVATILWQVLFN